MRPVDSLESAMSRDVARVRIAAQPLEELNPADPLGFVDDTVGYVFARLRREDPIHRSHSPIAGHWNLLVGYALPGHRTRRIQPRCLFVGRRHQL